MSDMLRGIFTAIVTPFRGEEIDWPALERLVEEQLEGGVHGIVPCGTTGESATLREDEHDDLVRFVVERVDGRVPVVAGVGSCATAVARRRAEHAREVGADACLLVMPYYNRPGAEGLVAHAENIAGAGLPVVLYNIPSRTGVALDLATVQRMAEIPGVIAIKEASCGLALAEGILAEGWLRVLSGDDRLALPLLCLGAHGVISVASNVAPRALVDLYDLVREGDLERARELHYRLLPLFEALFLESNPGPVKAALAATGLLEDGVRPPLTPAGEATRRALDEALAVLA